MPRLLTLIFQLVGTLSLLGSLYAGNRSLEFIRGSRPVPGTVIANEPDGDTWHAVVRYRGADDSTYTLRSEVGSSPPAFDIGEEVTVRLAPDGTGARIDSFFENWFVTMFFLIFALVFGGIGFLPPFLRSKRQKEAAYLKQAGESIVAKRVEVARTSYTVNDRHHYYLRCKADVDGVEREFKSAKVPFDPTADIDGRQVKIWYLPRDPGRYVVDIGFLDGSDGTVQPSASR